MKHVHEVTTPSCAIGPAITNISKRSYNTARRKTITNILPKQVYAIGLQNNRKESLSSHSAENSINRLVIQVL